ncbi:hypothetical protein FB446DRAFT_131705 [Lentinula raphanica]|nr:hypothetical protein FB446DRAFT_131705 [Lentinula raphanica]
MVHTRWSLLSSPFSDPSASFSYSHSSHTFFPISLPNSWTRAIQLVPFISQFLPSGSPCISVTHVPHCDQTDDLHPKDPGVSSGIIQVVHIAGYSRTRSKSVEYRTKYTKSTVVNFENRGMRGDEYTHSDSRGGQPPKFAHGPDCRGYIHRKGSVFSQAMACDGDRKLLDPTGSTCDCNAGTRRRYVLCSVIVAPFATRSHPEKRVVPFCCKYKCESDEMKRMREGAGH